MNGDHNNSSRVKFSIKTFLETSLIATLLLILIVLTKSETPENLTVQGFILVSFVTATYLAFRFPSSQGKFLQIVILEGLRGIILAGLLFGIAVIIYLITRNQTFFGEASATQTLSMVMLLFSAFGYYAWKIFLWVWNKWHTLRKTHFQWNLTHNFVVIILTALIFFFVINLILVLFDVYPYSSPGNNPSFLAKIFQDLSQVIFPHVMVFLLLAFVSILLALPPLILFSYLSTRKFTKRLLDLTQATKALKDGDLSTRTIIVGEDEVSQLQTSFNLMAENLQSATHALEIEKDKVTELLKNQKELTATISHELRTPVSTLIAYLENNLSHTKTLTEQTRHDLEIMLHEAQQLDRLINDLFTIAQTETNQLSLQFQLVQLNQEIPKWIDPVKQLAWKNQRVEISANFSKDLPPIKVDSIRLEQILLNLIHNALRHTQPGGLIQVNTEKRENTVRISVVDTGEGIAADELPFIWEKYYRGKTNQHQGSGLGLALVKELANAMHAEVGVESVLFEGSRFWIDFPLP